MMQLGNAADEYLHAETMKQLINNMILALVRNRSKTGKKIYYLFSTSLLRRKKSS
jgi:hypothetical protein